jgi:uncharacterized protein
MQAIERMTDKPELSRQQKRRRFFKRLLGWGTVSGASSVLYGFQYAPDHPVVERVSIPIAGLPAAAEGLRIVQLSDIHLFPHTTIELVRHVVAEVNRLAPDLVLLTGDYVLETADSIAELAPALAQMNPRQGIFSVLGNHDIWTNKTAVTDGLVKAGIPVLHNKGLVPGGIKPLFYLAGMDDGWGGEPDLPSVMANHTGNLPTILLFHEPDFADRFAVEPRLSLQLSGHSHGGQVRIPGIGAPILPRYGRKYDMGLYRVKEMWLYTTRGVGVIGVPIRLNCRPEITEITLTR